MTSFFFIIVLSSAGVCLATETGFLLCTGIFSLFLLHQGKLSSRASASQGLSFIGFAVDLSPAELEVDRSEYQTRIIKPDKLSGLRFSASLSPPHLRFQQPPGLGPPPYLIFCSFSSARLPKRGVLSSAEAMLLSLPKAKSILHRNAQFQLFSPSSNPSRKYWLHIKSTIGIRLPPISCTIQHGPTSSALSSHGLGGAEVSEEEDQEFRILTAVQTSYNDIVIVETREYRALLLDSTHNVHSIINKGPDKWTDSYWDEFAALPAIIPRDGPVAILGLGGGTAAHLMLDAWPGLDIEGWEIDGVLIDKARDCLGLSALERPQGGSLEVRIGDALSPSPGSEGRYAGIVVDLFGGGKVLPPLEEEATWAELKGRLMPGGRIMVNCGGIDRMSRSWASPWQLNPTIRAMKAVFGGGEGLNWKKTAGDNYMALTGRLPDLEEWGGMLPIRLRENVKGWSLVS